MVTKFLESGAFQMVVTILTIWALFSDDIRVMATNKNADTGFDAVNIVCLVPSLNFI